MPAFRLNALNKIMIPIKHPTTYKLCLCLMVCSMLLFSCAKENKNNPLKDETIPPAIRAMIAKPGNCTCEPLIREYKWREQTVYLFSCAGPACDCRDIYYDENGQKITMAAGYSTSNFYTDAQFLREVWRCKP